ncbi:acetyl-CoA carboxylase biotin carboxyl carrier protein (plastid) [Chondrus crispus]|uniref:Biotin carboxyl carrier protein of acetyl-CoA carboxylase n=1 Tax=Chondrus crispus TaxID=2769 RepID=M5DDF5_CHOCR|nr:acetyl-CoA carboxylase biotin carboxyl carrier protein [Chondrus crispus]CCP38143.1 acetyl-CoA carboxylase biotin carboxyl carrier protein [Chondrus crispus]|eukprot:YP_007627396.1 acetyl-CoA carboxylase biotin carboxyl carrier protein (plastid) [Chondrus crispus]
MKFQIDDLKQLLHSIQNKQIQEINVKSQEFELTINKSDIINKQIIGLRNKNTNVKKSTNNQISSIPDNELSNRKLEIYSTIVSPMVGTFYRSPAPGEPSFIDLYDIVQQKQTVCIIEAMKLMNEIEAEVNGEIVEILVQDGDIVDCGQALMKVKPILE